MATAPPAPNSKGGIWNRLPHESEQAWGAWLVYRDMEPPRSLRRVGEELGKSETLIERWSSRWTWGRRLEAFLQDREHRRLYELEKTIRQTKERHIGIAQMLQAKALERLRDIDTKLLSPDAVVKFLDLAVEMERKSLGIESGPIKQVAEISNATVFNLSELPQSELQERLQRISPVSRDLIRQLTMKTLQMLELQTGIHDGSVITISSGSDSAPGENAGNQSAEGGEAKPSVD